MQNDGDCFYFTYEELKPGKAEVELRRNVGFYFTYEELKLIPTRYKKNILKSFLLYL